MKWVKLRHDGKVLKLEQFARYSLWYSTDIICSEYCVPGSVWGPHRPTASFNLRELQTKFVGFRRKEKSVFWEWHKIGLENLVVIVSFINHELGLSETVKGHFSVDNSRSPADDFFPCISALVACSQKPSTRTFPESDELHVLSNILLLQDPSQDSLTIHSYVVQMSLSLRFPELKLCAHCTFFDKRLRIYVAQ